MNLNLAAMYGTPGAPVQEDQTKLAEAELFSKLAADNGIDLNQLNDEQLQNLWDMTFQKTAEEEPEGEKEESKAEEKKEDEEKEEKKEAAAREHAVKVAHAEEEERAHYLGQVMAHSYVSELSKIAAAREAQGTETVATTDDGVKEAAMPPALAKALGKVKSVGSAAMGKGKELAGKAGDKVEGARQSASKFVKDKPAASVGMAAVGGYGAGRAAGHFGKKKEGSASTIDELALEEAVKLAHAAGLDPEVAAARVSAVYTLGLDESTKLASDIDSQINIRALEYLEAAGYPVTWPE